MTKDPEAGSIAGRAAWRAWESFEASRGVPLERWVALHVKQRVWSYWRELKVRRAEQLQCDVWVAEPEETGLPDLLGLSREDWEVLWEKHVDRWPVDVIARRRGWSQLTAERKLRAALSRLDVSRCSRSS